MIVMNGNDINSQQFIMDISTTRLFSVHAYLVSGIGNIEISQSNFNDVDRFENISTIEMDVTNPEKKNAVVSVKDAPCKYFMIEFKTIDLQAIVELEIIYK